MGRPPKSIDTETMLELISLGLSNKEVAQQLEISIPTLLDRIEKLKKGESALLAYEKVQHLDLIGVQQRLVAGVTDEKIAEAPLGQIASAFGIFNKAGQLAQGRPTEIHGLMGYLMLLEKEDIENRQNNQDPPIDVTPTEGDGNGK